MNVSDKFSELSQPARTVWAKSGDGFGHSVLGHLLDVAAVAERLLEHEPDTTLAWAADTFGLSICSCKRWIAALAGLHDFGKVIPGFQCKWEPGWARDVGANLGFSPRALDVTDHACATGALLGEGLLKYSKAAPMWVRHILQAISAHHGYNFRTRELADARPQREGREWSATRTELLNAYWDTLSPHGAPAVDELSTPAVQWLAGLTSISDWIGSNTEWFPQGERHNSLREYFQDAKARATQALRDIHWSAHSALLSQPADTSSLLSRMLGRPDGVEARPLQHIGDDLLLGATGPVFMLVEAPMGEGKTELAFLAHLRLQAANAHRGLYVAMPTQASGRALFDRALAFLDAFADGRTLDIQLVHSEALADERITRIRGINHSSADSVSASAWFSQRRRPLISPYGVGTVDQALFAALNVKHHFVRLWGLANRVVVLDEVHAYDTYTTGLIEALLRWLKAMGSSVVLLSATLPRDKRDALLRAWGIDPSHAPDFAYPRLLMADASNAVRGREIPARPMPTIELHAIPETVDDLAACAARQLAQGGCGAIIVNTVDRAQQLYSALRQTLEDDTQLILFHARYPAADRDTREQGVLDRFGKDSKQRPLRGLLIATQVAEQSLDLDFDFMLTDLAPVDLILQRAGRLHRHPRPRPAAHTTARLFVAGLDPSRLPDLETTAWQYVYDAYILGRTWALLSRESVLEMPAAIDRLVQAVYGDADLPDDLERQAREFIETESFGEYRARINDQRMQSLNIAIDPNQEPQNAYLNKPRGNEEGDGLGLTNRTRLGEDNIALVPVHVAEDGWRVHPGELPFSPEGAITDDIARRLRKRQVRLARKAVVRHFGEQETPPAFAQHPLLAHVKPLPLSNGCYRIGESLTLRLDDELGLIYETNRSAVREY